MSPTCTIPYEVLLEFSNDTADAVTMQVLRREESGQAGPVMYLHRGENVSLVLTAGMAYKYALRQPPREVELSVKIWSDTQCNLSDVYNTPSSSRCCSVESGIVVTEGITVTSKASLPVSAQRHPTRYSHIPR